MPYVDCTKSANSAVAKPMLFPPSPAAWGDVTGAWLGGELRAADVMKGGKVLPMRKKFDFLS